MATNKRAWKWLTIPLVLGLGIFVVVYIPHRATSPMDSEARFTQKAAQRVGLDATAMLEMYRAEEMLNDTARADEGMAKLAELTESSQFKIRQYSYGVVAKVKDARLRTRALAMIQRMRNDPDPRVRAMYSWDLMLIDSPDWEQVCHKLSQSKDEQVQFYARLALQESETKVPRG